MTVAIIDPTLDDTPWPFTRIQTRLGAVAFGIVCLGALASLIWSVVAAVTAPMLLTAIR